MVQKAVATSPEALAYADAKLRQNKSLVLEANYGEVETQRTQALSFPVDCKLELLFNLDAGSSQLPQRVALCISGTEGREGSKGKGKLASKAAVSIDHAKVNTLIVLALALLVRKRDDDGLCPFF